MCGGRATIPILKHQFPPISLYMCVLPEFFLPVCCKHCPPPPSQRANSRNSPAAVNLVTELHMESTLAAAASIRAGKEVNISETPARAGQRGAKAVAPFRTGQRAAKVKKKTVKEIWPFSAGQGCSGREALGSIRLGGLPTRLGAHWEADCLRPCASFLAPQVLLPCRYFA
jgi:hypothetical protein